jgi:acyl-coenzyme A synthetase/AMP-(fatty) acid ligase
VLTVVVTDPDDVPGLRARARTLPASHRPRRWEVRDALPLTEAGKVDRNTLAATLDATLTATPAARSAGQERDD